MRSNRFSDLTGRPTEPPVSARLEVALDERIRRRQAMRFARGAYNDKAVFGLPLRMSDRLVLVREITGSARDGLVILRRGDISELCPSRADLQMEELCRRRRIAGPPVPDLYLSSWQSVCKGLAGSGRIVEVVDERGGNLDIGRVLAAGHSTLHMRCLDRLGFWERRRKPIRYQDITRMHLPVCYSAVQH